MRALPPEAPALLQLRAPLLMQQLQQQKPKRKSMCTTLPKRDIERHSCPAARQTARPLTNFDVVGRLAGTGDQAKVKRMKKIMKKSGLFVYADEWRELTYPSPYFLFFSHLLRLERRFQTRDKRIGWLPKVYVRLSLCSAT